MTMSVMPRPERGRDESAGDYLVRMNAYSRRLEEEVRDLRAALTHTEELVRLLRKVSEGLEKETGNRGDE